MPARRKIPFGSGIVIPIGDSEPDEPADEPIDAAIARRQSDALEQVARPPAPSPARPAPDEPTPPKPASSPPPLRPQAPEPSPIDPEILALKARLEREATRSREQDKRNLLASILPVVDNLDRSVAAAASSPDQALVQGIRVVRDQLQSVLTDLGALRIDSVGQRFDPALHEAIALAEVDDPARDGIVVDEWEAGYRLGGRILRPARVRVGKLALPPSAEEPDDDPEDGPFD